MKKKHVLFVLCLLNFSQSNADIYKCVDKNERVFYRDCPPNAKFKRIIKTTDQPSECFIHTTSITIVNDIAYSCDYPVTGLYKTYYENGNKKGMVYLKDGKFNGLMTVWDEDGNIALETSFKDGKNILVNDVQSK